MRSATRPLLAILPLLALGWLLCFSAGDRTQARWGPEPGAGPKTGSYWQVDDVRTFHAEHVVEPGRVARTERAPQKRRGVLAHGPAIPHGEPGRQEEPREPRVGSHERDDVIGSRELRVRREIDQHPLGAADLAGDDDVDDLRSLRARPRCRGPLDRAADHAKSSATSLSVTMRIDSRAANERSAPTRSRIVRAARSVSA